MFFYSSCIHPAKIIITTGDIMNTEPKRTLTIQYRLQSLSRCLQKAWAFSWLELLSLALSRNNFTLFLLQLKVEMRLEKQSFDLCQPKQVKKTKAAAKWDMWVPKVVMMKQTSTNHLSATFIPESLG
jgi:hypothetical protein